MVCATTMKRPGTTRSGPIPRRGSGDLRQDRRLACRSGLHAVTPQLEFSLLGDYLHTKRYGEEGLERFDEVSHRWE